MVGISPVREAILLKMKPGHLKELEAQVEEMTGLYSKSFDLVERCGLWARPLVCSPDRALLTDCIPRMVNCVPSLGWKQDLVCMTTGMAICNRCIKRTWIARIQYSYSQDCPIQLQKNHLQIRQLQVAGRLLQLQCQVPARQRQPETREKGRPSTTLTAYQTLQVHQLERLLQKHCSR